MSLLCRSHRFLTAGAIFPLLLTLAVGLRGGDTIYGNIASHAVFAYSNGWTVGDGGGGDRYVIAVSFTPRVNDIVTEIDLGLTYLHGANYVTVQLVADADGHPGSVVLGAWPLRDLPRAGAPDDAPPSPPEIIALTTLVRLQAHTRYWLVVSPGDRTTAVLWNTNDQDVYGGASLSTNGGVFRPIPGLEVAFAVQGTPATARQIRRPKTPAPRAGHRSA